MSGRRSNGAGSITQRKDGRWQGAVTDPDTGKRKYVYGKTKAEAQAKLIELQERLDNGLSTSVDRTTVGEFLSYWLHDVIKHEIRPRTWDSYRAVVEQHLIPGIGDIKLHRLRTQHVQDYVNAKLAEGTLSNRTIEYHRAVLRAALNHAIDEDRLTKNVATAVKIPRHKPPRIEPLTPEQVKQLFDYMEKEQVLYRPLIMLATLTGMRQGEILGLKWEDIDFRHKRIHVRQQMQRVDKRYQLVDLKTDESRRTLPLLSILEEPLKEWRDLQNQHKLDYREKWDEYLSLHPEWEGLVFTTRYGSPISARNLLRHFKNTLSAAGLPEIRFHDLRHTTATLLLALGVDMKTIQTVLGHSQISLTMNTYAHVLPAMTEEALHRVENVFRERN